MGPVALVLLLAAVLLSVLGMGAREGSLAQDRLFGSALILAGLGLVALIGGY